jgi:crotonobetainyl-CoA:carnitine CoA-transferase CaiB-like acyl-CoA transferase
MRGMLLQGVKVVEWSTWVAGPGCAAIMADWGADVIKIESAAGDATRGFFPDTDESPANPIFWMENRGKRGVVLDISKPAGREALIAILKDADIFVTNVRPGALTRARLDYESLKGELPGLIYCTVTGYGLVGDEADLPAFDLAAFWARSGVGRSTVPSDIDPFPCRPGFGDHTCALAALSAVLAALHEKGRTGKGRLVESSLIRTGAYVIGWDLSIQLRYGEVQTNQPRDQRPSPISGYFRTADGRWFTMAPRGVGEWPRICDIVLERPELTHDPRFATPEARRANNLALLEILDAAFGALSYSEVAARLSKADVIFAPFQTLADLAEDPQAQAAGCFVEVPDGRGGRILAPAAPARFPGLPHGPAGPAPQHGEHTREVLMQAGYSAAQVEALIASGAALGTPSAEPVA